MKKWIIAVLFLCTGLAGFYFIYQQNQPDVETRFGVKVESVTLSARNRIVDLRIRVRDQDKAASLFDKSINPILIVESSGKKIGIATSDTIGPLRNVYKPDAGKVYPFEFLNMPSVAKVGDKVTVVIGNFRKSGLVIQ